MAHSTMLGNGNRVTIELAEALAPVVPVDGPHFLFASDGAAACSSTCRRPPFYAGIFMTKVL
jgi:adenosylmethionine-8-amino-7-oxononanoate aminotransferase